mgnify:CR=1 FL=1
MKSALIPAVFGIAKHEKLDKDRFRRDLGGVEDAYAEMMKRVGLD